MSKFGMYANKSIVKDIKPLSNVVLVTDIEQGEKVLTSGIIIADDDGSDRGIRPRWAKVWKVGKNIDYIKPNEWILISHGRWTRAFYVGKKQTEVRMIDSNDILLVSDTDPLKD